MPFFERLTRSKTAIVGLSAAAVLAVGLFHWLGEREMEVAIFDLAPISFCSWYLGFPAGLGIAVLSALVLLGIDLSFGLDSYSRATVPFWNNWMRLGIFTLVANLVARLAEAVEREKEASSFKSKMLSLVTHEFNHSLTVIGVALSLLGEGGSEGAAESRRSILMTIQRQHSMLKQLVANYLNFNRMQSGRLELKFKPTLARPLVEDCVRLLAPLSSQMGVEVALEFPAEEARVRADPDALALVVSNLIGNAVKFTQRGGKVVIRMAPSKRAAGQIRFAVEDNGAGISKADQQRIRSGVYEVGAEKLTSPQGFGLGLRLVEEVLRGHGSSLTIQSWPNEGSIFSFDLAPWKEPARKKAPRP